MSNKKLTTEEKIEKSRQYTEEMNRMKRLMKEKRAAQQKLDKEIAEELEKAELLSHQKLGKRFIAGIKAKLPQEKYEEIMDFMFMHEDCIAFINEMVESYGQYKEKSENNETVEKTETYLSDDNDIPA